MHKDMRALLSRLTIQRQGRSSARSRSCSIVDSELRWVCRSVQQAEHQGLNRMELVGHHLLEMPGCRLVWVGWRSNWLHLQCEDHFEVDL